MSIEIECPSCGQRYESPTRHAGKEINCPGCGGAINVPPLESGADTEQQQASPEPANKTLVIARFVLAAVFAVWLLVNLAISIPDNHLLGTGRGAARQSISRSETDDTIQNAKHWADLYLSPVGWYAVLAKDGLDVDSAHLFKRDPFWRKAFSFGRFFTGVVCFVMVPVPQCGAPSFR